MHQKKRSFSILSSAVIAALATATSGCGGALPADDAAVDSETSLRPTPVAGATSDAAPPKTGLSGKVPPGTLNANRALLDQSGSHPVQRPDFSCSKICNAQISCNEYCEINTAPSTCREYGWCTEPPPPTFCDYFGGRNVTLYTAHNKWVRDTTGAAASNNSIWDTDQTIWNSSASTFMVDCYADGTVSLKRPGQARTDPPRYIAQLMPPNGNSWPTDAPVTSDAPVTGYTAYRHWTPIRIGGTGSSNWGFKISNPNIPYPIYLRAGDGPENWALYVTTNFASWESFFVQVR